MEPHETAGACRGSAMGDAPFSDSPGAVQLTSVEAYLLEALERLDSAETKASQLKAALEHSREIGAAIGVLMALRKLTRDQAFDLLRQASMAQNVKVHVLAARVVETGSTDPA